MNITKRMNDDVLIIDLEGNLDTATATEAGDKFQEIIKDEYLKVIVNLEKTDYIASSGLRVFLMLAKELDKINGKAKFCNLNSVIEQVFEFSGFDSFIDVYKTEEEALKAF